MTHPDWRRVRNLLVVRLDNLGDVLLATPAIRAVRRSLPRARITLLTSEVGAQAARLNPDLSGVMVYEAPWVDPWASLPHDPGRALAFIRRLAGERFDAAIILTSYHQSALPAAYACYLAGIPLRLAASEDGSGSLLTTRHRHPARAMHEVERGLDLVASVGLCPEDPELDLVLEVPERARARARAELGARGWSGERLVVVHPGSSMPARMYPAEMYAEVADEATSRLGATVVVTGSRQERDLVSSVRSRMSGHAISLAGDLTFEEFSALVEMADAVVTNNTGPMHLAAAVGTPVVALFALTNPPEQWGPWRVPHRVLYHDVPCRLCYKRVCPMGQACLRGVPPSAVMDAVAELAERRAARGEALAAPEAVAR